VILKIVVKEANTKKIFVTGKSLLDPGTGDMIFYLFLQKINYDKRKQIKTRGNN
jgi:hypothetical protein